MVPRPDIDRRRGDFLLTLIIPGGVVLDNATPFEVGFTVAIVLLVAWVFWIGGRSSRPGPSPHRPPDTE